jgi:anti-sigma B factor antagonist
MGEVNAGIRKIVCNLEDVTYIASAGIGVLMSVSKTLQEKNGLMVLSSASVGVQKVFRLFGFGDIMHIFDSEEQAFSYFDSLTN